MLRKKRYYPPKPLKLWEGPKPVLSMFVTLTCRVHYRDLEDYLLLVYKIQEYDVRKLTGACGDMTPEFIVTGVLPKTPNICQQANNIRRGKKTSLSLILDVLCVDGFIRPGKYIIDMTPEPTPIEAYRFSLNKDFNPSNKICTSLKLANKRDKDFMRLVKILDQRVLEFKDTQGEKI